MEIDLHFTQLPFAYIKQRYKVNAGLHREVIVNGKKGVIVSDMGNYIGVQFYDNPTIRPMPCHPTSGVEYLESFNKNLPAVKLTASQKKYRDFLQKNLDMSFREYLGINSFNKHKKKLK